MEIAIFYHLHEFPPLKTIDFVVLGPIYAYIPIVFNMEKKK